MKLVILAEAQRRYDLADTWWRTHRDEKHLFVVEFEEALEQLQRKPIQKRAYTQVRGQLVHRRLMPKTGYHVYYVYKAEQDTLEIWTIWHAKRGAGPKLG